MSKKPVKYDDDPNTTGHSWDGIEEFDNPMPRWWLWTLYLCIIWAIGYSIAYPAWPMINSATAGILGWSSRGEVTEQIAAVEEGNASIITQLVEVGTHLDCRQRRTRYLCGFRRWCRVP
ncbi:UNVERIFIED_CONTAM: hypothetical protein GTU68_040134 [Idotea baltica]|nr:hypothetical protein [Idotea baltica]